MTNYRLKIQVDTRLPLRLRVDWFHNGKLPGLNQIAYGARLEGSIRDADILTINNKQFYVFLCLSLVIFTSITKFYCLFIRRKIRLENKILCLSKILLANSKLVTNTDLRKKVTNLTVRCIVIQQIRMRKTCIHFIIHYTSVVHPYITLQYIK